MKIDAGMVAASLGTAGTGRVSVRPAEGPSAVGAGEAGSVASRVDAADLSQTAREVCAARKALAAAPDVREDRVAELQQKIADGTFEVDADLIAEKIIAGGP